MVTSSLSQIIEARTWENGRSEEELAYCTSRSRQRVGAHLDPCRQTCPQTPSNGSLSTSSLCITIFMFDDAPLISASSTCQPRLKRLPASRLT